MRHLTVVWLLLFGLYTAVLLANVESSSESLNKQEARQLLIVDSIVKDRDIDLTNQYAQRSYREWYKKSLKPQAKTTEGRLYESLAVGTALAVSPAYAVGGKLPAEILIAAITALAFAISTLLARRVVPQPWATVAPLVCGLSPPALAYSTTVGPAPLAAAVVSISALLAVKTNELSRRRYGFGSATLIGTLPWVGLSYLAAGLVPLAAAVRSFLSRGRRLAALLTCEIVLTSLIACIRFNDQIFGGLTPQSLETQPASSNRKEPGLVTLSAENGYDLLLWLPFTVLAGYSIYLAWRWRQTRLTRALPEQNETHRNIGLLTAIVAVQLAVTVTSTTLLSGDNTEITVGSGLFAATPALGALAALGLRHLNKVGYALCAVTLTGSGLFFIY